MQRTGIPGKLSNNCRSSWGEHTVLGTLCVLSGTLTRASMGDDSLAIACETEHACHVIQQHASGGDTMEYVITFQ